MKSILLIYYYEYDEKLFFAQINRQIFIDIFNIFQETDFLKYLRKILVSTKNVLKTSYTFFVFCMEEFNLVE